MSSGLYVSSSLTNVGSPTPFGPQNANGVAAQQYESVAAYDLLSRYQAATTHLAGVAIPSGRRDEGAGPGQRDADIGHRGREPCPRPAGQRRYDPADGRGLHDGPDSRPRRRTERRPRPPPRTDHDDPTTVPTTVPTTTVHTPTTEPPSTTTTTTTVPPTTVPTVIGAVVPTTVVPATTVPTTAPPTTSTTTTTTVPPTTTSTSTTVPAKPDHAGPRRGESCRARAAAGLHRRLRSPRRADDRAVPGPWSHRASYLVSAR